MWALGGASGTWQLPAEVRERHRRERMIVALAQVVHDCGEEPAVERALAVARMSRTSLYKLFGSKQGLIESACLEATRRLVDRSGRRASSRSRGPNGWRRRSARWSARPAKNR